MIEALDKWAEKGVPPEKVIASRIVNGAVQQTRPLCPYPQEAQWKGAGSTDDAANFRLRVTEAVKSPSSAPSKDRRQPGHRPLPYGRVSERISSRLRGGGLLHPLDEAVAIPCPTPMHIVQSAYLPPVFFS